MEEAPSAREPPVRRHRSLRVALSLVFLLPSAAMAQAFGVSVTPQGGSTPNRLIQTGGYTQSFRVQNEGTAQDTWTLTCVGASSVISASCQSSITLAGNSFQNVTVTYRDRKSTRL